MTARLFLVLALRFGFGAHRLSIGDDELFALDTDAELAREPLHRDVEMRLAGAREHGLVGLVVAAHDKRGVLLLETVEGGHQLVFVGFALGVDGDRKHREGGLGQPVAGRTRAGAS